MKILIISPGLKPVPAVKGGAVENLIEMLITNNEVTQKHKITVFTIYDKKVDEIKNKLKCKINFIKTSSKIYKINKILRFIINSISKTYIGNQFIHSVIKQMKKDKEEYDIILVENAPEYGLVLNKIKGKAKLILHLHNDFLNVQTKNAKKIEKVYDKIFSISEFIKNRVNEINGISKKNEVLYNGIDTSRFNAEIYDKDILREKYGLNKDDFVFMYSGRLVPEKGVKEMIQAFCKIKDAKCKLLIVGNGKEKYYNELISQSVLRKKDIIFMGYVNYQEISEIYAISDIGIVPSTCNEAFGLTVIEFLASGVPVIISDRGAMKEIVNLDGICAEIVNVNENYVENLKDTMLYYLKIERENMEQMKKNAVLNSKEFTKEIYVHNFLRLIKEEEYEQNK